MFSLDMDNRLGYEIWRREERTLNNTYQERTSIARKQCRSISMIGVLIPAVDSHRHLGLILNKHLTRTNHIDSVYTTCARKIGMLNRLSHSVDKDTLARIYLGFIRLRLDCACALRSGRNTDKIVKLQKKFCRRNVMDSFGERMF